MTDAMSDAYDTRERCVYCGFKAEPDKFVQVNNLKTCPRCHKVQYTYVIVRKDVQYIEKSISKNDLSRYIREGWKIVGYDTY